MTKCTSNVASHSSAGVRRRPKLIWLKLILINIWWKWSYIDSPCSVGPHAGGIYMIIFYLGYWILILRSNIIVLVDLHLRKTDRVWVEMLLSNNCRGSQHSSCRTFHLLAIYNNSLASLNLLLIRNKRSIWVLSPKLLILCLNLSPCGSSVRILVKLSRMFRLMLALRHLIDLSP